MKPLIAPLVACLAACSQVTSMESNDFATSAPRVSPTGATADPDVLQSFDVGTFDGESAELIATGKYETATFALG